MSCVQEKKYLALTGRKYDKMEGLIGPEQIAKERKQEEEGGEKNTGVIYEFWSGIPRI